MNPITGTEETNPLLSTLNVIAFIQFPKRNNTNGDQM